MRQSALPDPGEFLLLDGGLATELERRGHRLDDPLWSARVLLDAPQWISEVHADYLRAGADVLITASYQASLEGLAARGLSPQESADLLRKSVDLAHDLCRQHPAAVGRERGPWIAASVGPYGATRHDGSEYHGNYDIAGAQLADWHRSRLAILAESNADLLACETIPSLDEALAIAALLDEHGSRAAWISFTTHDGIHVAHGEELTQCARMLDRVDGVIAVGINCSAPDYVETGIRALRKGTRKPIVAYPNSGETWDPATRSWRWSPKALTPAEYPAAACRWIAAGANWIGGCCRTGPAHIAALAQHFGHLRTP